MIRPLAKFSYDASLGVRRKFLGAKLKQHEGNYPLSYLEFGRPDAPTLVFFHGFSDEKHNFFLPGKLLSKNYRILVPDIPGFGDSAKYEDKNYTLSNYALWLSEFLKREAFGPVHLVGNSLGGAISMRMALDFPQLIKSLTLVNSAGLYLPGLADTTFYQRLAAEDNPFWFDHHSDIDEFFKYIFEKKPFIPWPIDRHWGELMVKNRDWHKKLLEDLVEGASPDSPEDERVAKALNEQIHQIKVPTHIFWGAKDQLFPIEIGKEIKDRIAHAKFEVFPNLGHCPHSEAPMKFAKTLHSHLKHF